jgi:predicted nucleic acid-binding Zn finger protein
MNTLKTKQIAKTKTTTTKMNRTDKALALVEGVMKSSTTDSYFVPSQTTSGMVYEVSPVVVQQYVCTCPAFEFRRENDDGCKHIEAVKIFLAREGGGGNEE